MNVIKYQPVIGLEVHVELKTKSKMFCGCSADYFGEKPNSNTCPVCLGLPGALPVPNKKAIEWCVMIGLALNCKIANFSKFDRKNYFYADLPKGYQISQYDQPLAINGSLKLKIAEEKIIRITRVHMEEDTAKLMHQFKIKNGEGYSLIDFNRSGVPLVEIVTEPDFENSKQVVEYLKKLQQIVRYLNVSDADMEKGEMRLEPNISLREFKIQSAKSADKIEELPSYRVEVKNINSFKFVEKAIEYEINRQTEILDSGKTPIQETRGWDQNRQKTVSQRVKEEANDYRYFPEPDIPPFRFSQSQISNLKSKIGELPNEKLERFQKNFGLSPYDAEILTREKEIADYFEQMVRDGKTYSVDPKQIANFIINRKIDTKATLPASLIQTIVKRSKKVSIDETKLELVINRIISQNQKAVEDYKKGKTNIIMFLLGQVIRIINEKVDANIVKEKIKKMLQ